MAQRLTLLIERIETESDLQGSHKVTETMIESWVRDAVIKHTKGRYTDLEAVPENEEQGILYLALANVAVWKAQENAEETPINPNGFSGDRDSAFSRFMRLAKSYESKYRDFVNDVNSSGGGTIVVGEFFRKDDVLDQPVPFSADPMISTPRLSVTQDGSSATLEWTRVESTNFDAYGVFSDLNSGIKQTWKTTQNDGFAHIAETATRLTIIYDRYQTALRVEDLEVGTHYFVVAVSTETGRSVVSNEVSVTVT